jgi:ParB/RepB/Spo0J family partition protein
MKTKATTKMWAAPSAIARNEEQPRTYFDADALHLLAQSLKAKQQQPVTVVPFSDPDRPEIEWKIVDGERRWQAAQAAGLKRLWIVLDDDVTSEDELHTASFAANWCRAGHTHRETAEAIDVQVKLGKSYEQIAAVVGKSESWAQKEHSLLKLAPEVLALMDPPTPRKDRLPSAVAYLLTKYPVSKQMSLWRQHKDRGGKTAFHHIRVDTRGGGKRSTMDDVRYITTRATSICSALKQLHALPGQMLGHLSGEQREQVASKLRAAAEEATQFAELLVAAVGGEVDEEG